MGLTIRATSKIPTVLRLTPPSHGIAGVHRYCRHPLPDSVIHKRRPHHHHRHCTLTTTPYATIPPAAKVFLPHRRAITTSAISMSRHPDFKTVEASRPDWDTSASLRYTKTAQPSWTPGSGANQLASSAPASQQHVAIDPYEEGRPATFNYKLLISAIAPRPIGFVSTRSGAEEETFNLAPFSYFNVLNHDPPIFTLGFSSPLSKPKDTLRHLVATGECTINIISEHFIEAANSTSIDAPTACSEWTISGLTPVYDCTTVKTPRAREAVFSVECKVDSMREFDSRANPGKKSGTMVLLEGLRFWVREDAVNEERNAIAADILRPMGRLGGITYGRITEVIELPRPVFERDVGMEAYEELKKKATTNGTAE
ncbi:hypothetical protein FHL15_007932 [Xylaria flabelliformis]|uniref:Flavin reductase like domain-containing protein n=1 Tax=Xylaria flabelliformis TaxID=2512241 RepID=A0A553HT76_9PEZI|nr:hypothetical protein FHL15_007932 [Xylaria flabelliformis]